MHEAALLGQWASVEPETGQHGPCDGVKGAAQDRGLLNEGAEAAVVMGTRQVNHPRQVGQEVAQLLFDFLPAEFVVGLLQIVVCDQVGAARELCTAW